MKLAYAFSILACLAGTAHAQLQTPTTTAPPPVSGFGTLSATAASTLLSTLTAGPNSSVWPLLPKQIFVMNAPGSAGVVYVCPKGGTCSASVGIPIAAGYSYGFYQPATAMTVFAASTATVVAQW